MGVYIHKPRSWPAFRWDQEKLTTPLAAVRHRQGRLIGRMEAAGPSLHPAVLMQTLTLDSLRSAETEDVILHQTS